MGDERCAEVSYKGPVLRRSGSIPRRWAHVISVSFDEALFRGGVVEHLVQEEDPLLHAIQLFADLGFVIRLLIGFLCTAGFSFFCEGGRIYRDPAARFIERTAPAMIFMSSCAAARSFGVPRRISSCSFCGVVFDEEHGRSAAA